MRIIAGERRGAQLFAPQGMDTRPTQAKVRESLFSIIQVYVPQAHVLDLFAGSGALAFEALSRGAEKAVLVDMDRDADACIRRNLEKLRYVDRIQRIHSDWRLALEKLWKAGETFDLVFLDPPYRMEEVGDCCQKLADQELLADGAMLVLEHRTGLALLLDNRFELFRQRTYGETEIHFFLYHAEGYEGGGLR